MPTSASATFGQNQVIPLRNAEDANQDSLPLAAGTYAAGTLVGEVVGTDEVQTIVATGATAGTFTATFVHGTTATSAAIPYTATAAQVQTALAAMSNVGAGNVQVSAGPLPTTAVSIHFTSTLGHANVSQLTTTDTLTGGTTTVATSTAGAAGTPGTWAAYSSTGAVGTQLPTHIVQYGCVFDASGNATMGTAGTSEWGQTYKSVPCYRPGPAVWRASDLVGLDQNAVDIGRILFVRGGLSDTANAECMLR